MKSDLNRKKQVAGLLYGLAAGLAFAFLTWGLDFILLARANGAFSWVKFVPGLLACLLCGSLAGWLTITFQKGWLTFLLWTGMALLFSELAIWLPIKISPAIIKVLDGELGSQLMYPYYPEYDQYFWFGFIATVVAAIICGLLENVLIEQALFSTGIISAMLPPAICVICFGLAGIATDSLLNSYLRKPVQVVDALMQYAVDNTGKEVPSAEARAMHLAAVRTIKDYLPRERRLIVQEYDQSLFQIEVLIDFEGIWVECITVSDQVSYCKPLLTTP